MISDTCWCASTASRQSARSPRSANVSVGKVVAVERKNVKNKKPGAGSSQRNYRVTFTTAFMDTKRRAATLHSATHRATLITPVPPTVPLRIDPSTGAAPPTLAVGSSLTELSNVHAAVLPMALRNELRFTSTPSNTALLTRNTTAGAT
jgi:hypothetical protein